MKRFLIFLVVLGFLVVLIGGFGYFQFVIKPEMAKGFITAGGPPPVTISVEAVRLEKHVPQLPATGTLRAVRGVDVAPETPGIVREVHFISGESVEKGALLVTLDDAVDQADLKSAQAVLHAAALELRRKKELLGKGNVSRTAYDVALAERDVAAAAVERMKAVIAQKTIKAPFTGKLGISRVTLGTYVSSGTVLVTLQNLERLYADFPVPENHVTFLHPGQSVEVRVDARPGEVFTGRIQSLESKIEQDTRNIFVRAMLGNKEERLLPGMFANVTVLGDGAEEVMTLPRTAVTYSLYGDSVYVVKQDGDVMRAQRRFVRAGETREDRVAITQGLEPGEHVVTTGQIKLRDGASVLIDNEAAALVTTGARPKE